MVCLFVHNIMPDKENKPMPHYNTVMNELLNLVPRHEFERIVKEHGGDTNVKKFSCFQHFVVMLFAQLRGLDSLREIETALGVYQARWYHLGLKTVKRSTLADANCSRSWRIYEALYYRLLHRCQSFNPKHRFTVPNPIVSIDATIINLCLGLFPWSNYQNTKGAIKLHFQLDYAGYLPTCMVVTDVRQSELKMAMDGVFPFKPDSIVLMDRGFGKYSWYQRLARQGAWFIARGRSNMNYRVLGQHPLPEKSHVLADERIEFAEHTARKDYPCPLRLVTALEAKTRKPIRIVTNNFSLDADTISELYKARWKIETFFKWIKQHLKIKSFLGTSKNAVLTQIWIALCAYLLLSYIKLQCRYKHGLLELTRIIKETLLSSYSIIDLLKVNLDQIPKARSPDSQLELFA